MKKILTTILALLFPLLVSASFSVPIIGTSTGTGWAFARYDGLDFALSAPYFVATSTTATSTFKGNINVRNLYSLNNDGSNIGLQWNKASNILRLGATSDGGAPVFEVYGDGGGTIGFRIRDDQVFLSGSHYPLVASGYSLGSVALPWAGAFFDSITVPSFLTTATSTFTKGINISAGCFAIGGTCISGSSSGGSSSLIGLSVETPSGTVNGSNTTFTVLNTPSILIVNGQTMTLTTDYTISSLTITFVTAPPTGSIVRSYYGTGSGGNMYTAYADQTINTSAETTVFSTTFTGTTTIAANFLTVGKSFEMVAKGVYTTPLGNVETLTAKVKYGATTLATVTTAAFPASATNQPFRVNVTCTVRSIGASGSLICNGQLEYQTVISGTNIWVVNDLSNAGAATTVDTTAKSNLDATADWSATSFTTQSIKINQSFINFVN